MPYEKGFVYLCQRGPYVKAGESHWPESRVKGDAVMPSEIRALTPVLLWQLPCVDRVLTERALHCRLAAYHVIAEWFEPPTMLLASLMRQTEAELCRVRVRVDRLFVGKRMTVGRLQALTRINQVTAKALLAGPHPPVAMRTIVSIKRGLDIDPREFIEVL